MSDPRPEQEIRLVARECAREVVQELLDGAGVTLEDLIYLRKQRQGADQAAAWMKRTAISVFATGVGWALWLGLKAAMGR